MGRIVDLCGEIAAAVDEGPEGFVLPAEEWERLRGEWPEEDIQDAISFVTESIFQSELVEAADSLSAHLLDMLGEFGEEEAFESAVAGEATIDVEALRRIAHRLDRLEEILEVFRDEEQPDRKGFDALQRRLIDEGIESEMRPDWEKQGASDPADGGHPADGDDRDD